MDYIKHVNVKQGTRSTYRFSCGNTLPLVQRPFGFASFSPQTSSDRGTWFYHPDDKSFEGVRLTHQPSPWIGDHGAIVIMPQSGTPYKEAHNRWSGFREIALTPCYMNYFLKRSRCNFELTPTEYGAVMRFDFDNDHENYISVLPVGGSFECNFDKANGLFYCSTDQMNKRETDNGNFRAYFVFRFAQGTAEYTGDGHVRMLSKKTVVSMASSYISYEQALVNLEGEERDFDTVLSDNNNIWNEHLGRIGICADENKTKTFYSCMYRVFLYPHKAHEISREGKALHYVPSDGTIKKGVRYTDNGFWDTYRTNYALYSLIAKEECKEIIKGYIQDYIDSGWLPRWTAMNALNCMPSTMLDAIIADAALNGTIGKELLSVAFEGMEKQAEEISPVSAYGREGCDEYIKLGYVPYDDHVESVNLTLDAAYCDYCLSVVAGILGYKDKQEKYLERSKNYRNLFDRETGFMRARSRAGSFRPDFSPIGWGRDYTEASAWQTTFAVQHDLEGLALLFGGKEKFLGKLDELFAAEPDYEIGGYGCEIHEMTEMAVKNWGQCAVSNQPSFHIPFIYAYFGEKSKTEYWVKRICDEGFSGNDDGFPGDEDNGSMAAWYIFACLGKYPICPGMNEYVIFDGYIKDIKIREA